jgi:6-pyruvoyltetrahydropterin/6-carboxytetrahydropterin synthase
MRIAIYRKAHFNAAHRLYNPKWTHEKNLEQFGVCTSPNFHGHNYEIEVRVSGEVDPETGMLINLSDLKSLIKKEIEDRFDHKNFNLDVPEFQSVIPTAENICYIIWKILRGHLKEEYDLQVRLYETPRNFVEYPA